MIIEIFQRIECDIVFFSSNNKLMIDLMELRLNILQVNRRNKDQEFANYRVLIELKSSLR